MRTPQPIGLLLACSLLAAPAAGCVRRTPQPAAPEVLAVPVSRPVVRQVTDYVDLTGRTEAVQSVDIRPRTTGYLVKTAFEEGAEVKAGDLLFEIDPRPYKAQLDQGQGQFNLYQAQLKLARTTYARDRAINNITADAISRQQLDQDEAAVEEADARVKAYEKNMEVFRLNHEFTRVVSPIDGIASRYYLTLGNLVNQDQTLLTTVVSLDPMYSYFDMDEPTLLEIRTAINQGKMTRRRSKGLRVSIFMNLQGENGFPHEGSADFVNNQLNPTTGSILVRGVFDNPKPPRLLSPGMFVRIRLPIGEHHPAVLVIDRAIAFDQGMKFVCVIDEDDEAQYRRVTTGSLQEDGLRVITQGLRADDKVVVGGLQQVRPRTPVRLEDVPMPTLDPGTAGNASTAPAQAAPVQLTPTPNPGATHPGEEGPGGTGSGEGGRGGPRRNATLIARFFIDRPIFAAVLSVVITIVGFLALISLPIAQHPRITPPGSWFRSIIPGPAPRSSRTPWPRRSSSRSTACRACSTCPRRWAMTAPTP